MTAPYVKSVLEDQSTRVVSSNGVYTGIAIAAKKGEVGVPRLITNQTELLRVFTPNERIESGWDMAYYSAYYYLKEGSRLWVVRACADDARYSGLLLKVSGKGSNVAITTGQTNPANYNFGNSDACLIYASSQGKWGDDVGIKIVTDQSKVKLDGAFIIEVYKNIRVEDGNNVGDLVESHLVSFDVSLKTGYGTNCFIETVLEGSNYIRALVNDVAIEDNPQILPAPQTTILTMYGGTDGSAITVNQRINAIKKLSNPKEYPLAMLMDGGETSASYQNALLGICAERTDCIAILSVNYEATQNANKIDSMIAHRSTLSGSLPYLGSLYAPHQLMYDEFNDRNIYIDPATFVAGRSADVIENYGWHWSNAGYNRGMVNTLDVATSFTHEELDRLSDYEINCIIKEPGEGNLIYDQLTLQSKASDLQELPISRYINCYLRPALKDMLKYYLFEFNDAQTRADIEEKITNFMRVEKANRACYGFQVKCNEENNTANDIENNRLNVWLYIKPTKFAKFIEQKIVITPYSTSLANVSL